MNHFEITGWRLPTLLTSIEKALAVMDALSVNKREYCVEAYFVNLSDVQRIAVLIPNGRYAYYCWRSIENGNALNGSDFQNVNNACIKYGDTLLSVEYGRTGLPPYDWDGTMPSQAIFRLTRKYPAPLKPENRNPCQHTLNTISEIATEYFPNNSIQVKTMTEWMDGGRNHHYLAEIPRRDCMKFASIVCQRFDLVSGTGSFEISGSPTDLEKTVNFKSFKSDDYPPEAPSINGQHKTCFALEPNGFFVPVPNVNSQSLVDVARLRDELKNKVISCTIMSRYVSWKLSDSSCSPKVNGNYIMLSQRSNDYAIFLGYERYEDKDPTVRKFTSFALPKIEAMGGHLKEIAGPR
jgi:hypothetical protein